MWFGIVWTVVSAIGLGFYLALMFRSMSDLRFMRQKNIDGVRRTFIKLRLTIYIGLLGIQIIYLGVGFAFISIPELRLESVNDSAHFYTRIALLISTFLLAGLAYSTNSRTGHLIKLAMEQGGNDEREREGNSSPPAV